MIRPGTGHLDPLPYAAIAGSAAPWLPDSV